MNAKITLWILISLTISRHYVKANFITANSSNYTSFVSGLVPDDTLFLTAGNYANHLNLNNLNGTSDAPIVIMGSGNSTVFLGSACCNTVDITNCSYIVIRDFKIDGQNINYIDGVKAGGGGNYFAHHITLENLYIVNNGGNIEGDNQTVGISTKCAAWNWVIRGCTIIAAGTGIYLGNSNGTCPFVSGIIENNLVINTRGYNMQIKAQLDNVRQIFPGTSNDYQKTIIRYNVWSKDSGSTPIGVGDGSRPCLLMDNFPSTGYGANDTYEVYGNFFYNNPTEALMQVTGNTTAYDNIFVNHVAPSGYTTIVINNHDGFPPRKMNMFHNSILSNSDSGGIGLYNPNTNYQQYCYANAVFSNGTPITGFKAVNTVDNITDTYANAGTYVNSPSTTLSLMDLYPVTGQLQGTLTSDTAFDSFTDYNIDFNGDIYDWTYRGAYSGSGANLGWQLQLDIRPTPHGTTTATKEDHGVNDFLGVVYPNPATNEIQINLNSIDVMNFEIEVSNLEGHILKSLYSGSTSEGQNKITADMSGLMPGFYLLVVKLEKSTIIRKVLIQK